MMNKYADALDIVPGCVLDLARCATLSERM
jgi:hypothetical protein